MSNSTHSFADAFPRESDGFLLQILDYFEELISVKNDRLRFIFANDAFCTQKGIPRDKLLGKTLLELPLEDSTELIWHRENAVLKTGKSHIQEETLLDPSGSSGIQTTRIERITDKSGKHYILGITEDIARKQILRKSISTAVPVKIHGTSTRAAIHDLNNLLNVIKGYTELLLEEIETDDPNRKDLEAILKAGDRAANLASKF